MCSCPAHDDRNPVVCDPRPRRAVYLPLLRRLQLSADIMSALQKQGLLPDGVSIGADDVNGATAKAAASDIKVDGAQASRSERRRRRKTARTSRPKSCRGGNQGARRREGKEARRGEGPVQRPLAGARRQVGACTRRSTLIAIAGALPTSRPPRLGFALPRAACMSARIRAVRGSTSSFLCWSSPARTRDWRALWRAVRVPRLWRARLCASRQERAKEDLGWQQPERRRRSYRRAGGRRIPPRRRRLDNRQDRDGRDRAARLERLRNVWPYVLRAARQRQSCFCSWPRTTRTERTPKRWPSSARNFSSAGSRLASPNRRQA